MKRVVFQEELVKDLVAVLLVNVSTKERSILIFYTKAKCLFTVLIIYNFPLRYITDELSLLTVRKNLICLAQKVELFQVYLHLIRVLHRMMF